MPYAIRKRGDKWCVVRERIGPRPQETKKCHDTEAAAEAHKRALEIAEHQDRGE